MNIDSPTETDVECGSEEAVLSFADGSNVGMTGYKMHISHT
jgi:hypothetical protein